MNKLVAKIFAKLLEAFHFLFIVIVILVLASNDNIHAAFQNDPSTVIWWTSAICAVYVLIVGTLTTFVSINENLEQIKSELEKQGPDLRNR